MTSGDDLINTLDHQMNSTLSTIDGKAFVMQTSPILALIQETASRVATAVSGVLSPSIRGRRSDEDDGRSPLEGRQAASADKVVEEDVEACDDDEEESVVSPLQIRVRFGRLSKIRQNRVTSTSHKRSLYPLTPSLASRMQCIASYIEEEVFWEVRFAHNLLLRESKLFYFGNIWWSLLFGVEHERDLVASKTLSENKSVGNSSQFYFTLSPAEKLKQNAFLWVEFFLHLPLESTQSTQDSFENNRLHEKEHTSLHPHAELYSRCSGVNYFFPVHSVHTVRGFDDFIGVDAIQPYISSHGKVHLSVRLGSGIGKQGQLIGRMMNTVHDDVEVPSSASVARNNN